MNRAAFSDWLTLEKDAHERRGLQGTLNGFALSKRYAAVLPARAGELLENPEVYEGNSTASMIRRAHRESSFARPRVCDRALDAEWVEQHEGDLDAAYDLDRLEGLLARLTYTREEAEAGEAPRHKVPVAGEVVSGTRALRVAVAQYQAFRDEQAGLPSGAPGTRWTRESSQVLYRYVQEWISKEGGEP